MPILVIALAVACICLAVIVYNEGVLARARETLRKIKDAEGEQER